MIRPILSASVAGVLLALPALAETRTYEVSEFTAIDVSAGIELTFETGRETRVSVDNKAGKFDDILVKVDDDTLVLKRPRRGMIGSWSKRQPYAVTVTAPVLRSLDVTSGAEATGGGLSGDHVSIEVSSGANASIADISASQVHLEASSGAQLAVSGTCATVIAEGSSGASLDASKLTCQAARAEASSGAGLRVHATGRVNADASSGGDIDVYGQPAVTEIDKSSGGSVSLKG